MMSVISSVVTMFVAALGAAPVIDGTETAEPAAVVALVTELGLPYCTGTLIAPSVVLTAAHCASEAGDYVFFGADSGEPGAMIQIAGSVHNPGFSPRTLENDAALVWLARPAPFDGLVLRRTLVASGELVDLVGFGLGQPDQFGTAGIKRQREVQVTRVSTHNLIVTTGGCSGDSGGPGITRSSGELAGIISFGESTCDASGALQRIDMVVGWIDLAMQDQAGPTSWLDGRCASDDAARDPDCVDRTQPTEPVEPVASGGCTTSAGGAAVLPLLLALAGLARRRCRGAALAVLALGGSACTELASPPTAPQFCRARPIGDGDAPVVVTADVVSATGGAVALADALAAGTGGFVEVSGLNLDGCAVAVRVEVYGAAVAPTVAAAFVDLDDDGRQSAGFARRLPLPDLRTATSVTVLVQDQHRRWAHITVTRR